ncbi:RsmD family RNA methyltransferase [Candidatus Latescibacterota bacterium]
MEIHELDVTVLDDHYVYGLRDLRIKTDTWERRGADSVLGFGGSRRTKAPLLINYMLNHPEIVEGKRVFEPFAGAGPYGLLAVCLEAAFCDLLDLNPRAVQFMRDSVEMSGLDPSSCRIVEGDIGAFLPAAPYDIIFANPPFVPTPPSMEGVLHSNGGPDGCGATRLLFSKFDGLLKPEGRAFVWSLQIEGEAGPVLADDLVRAAPGRPVEMMETTDCHIDFDRLTGCLIAAEPTRMESILEWRDGLMANHGPGLTLNWYLIHIGPESSAVKGLSVTGYDAERYGEAYAPEPMNHLKRIQRLVDLEILR